MAAPMSPEDWRPCVNWLAQCRVLPVDHCLTNGKGTLVDLAQLLKDGVILCQLLNRLQPHAIDQKSFSHRPQTSQYLRRMNVKVFLETCRSKFGLKDSDLFQATDLLESTDFAKVLKTLSALSNTEAAKRLQTQTFSYDSNKVYTDLQDEEKRNSSDSAFEPGIYTLDEAEDEEIYASLVSDAGATASSPSQPKQRTNRDSCIDELVNTETKYVETLNSLAVCFVKPLESYLSPNDLKRIFFGIEDLYKVHKDFCVQLMLARSTDGPSCMISSCFIDWKPKFLVYGDYCAQLTSAQDLLDRLAQHDPRLDIKIKECQNNATEGRFKLRDMLTVPMQRVLKYHLLLRELIKHTGDGHFETEKLAEALSEMEDLALYINEVKRDYETREQIDNIEKSIIGLDMHDNTRLHDYGRLLKDGELKIRVDDSRVAVRYVFLFDKLMLLCKANKQDSYEWKDFVMLSQCTFQDSIQKDRYIPYNVVLVSKTPAVKYTFGSKDQEVVAKWRDAIHLALDNVNPRDAHNELHDFALVCLDKPTTCDVCFKLLRGFFFQGYRCPKTNMTVHKECISKARTMKCRPSKAPARLSRAERRVSYMEVTPRVNTGITNRPPIGTVKAVKTYSGFHVIKDGRRYIRFNAGDTFDLISKAKDGTELWEGRIGNSEGFFPAEFVEDLTVKNDSSPAQAPAANVPPAVPGRLPKQVSVDYPGGVRTGRRTTEPALPLSAKTNLHAPAAPTPTCRSPQLPKDYVNVAAIPTVDLTPFPWFAGPMGRDDAHSILEPLPDGCFLVRLSVTPGHENSYALSVKYKSPKHVRIYETPNQQFYLAENIRFPSIPKLVEFYQENSLSSCFPTEVLTVLLIPYRAAVAQQRMQKSEEGVLGHCVALYDYAASEPNQLSLVTGDFIAILSKVGENRGWWKGRLGQSNQIGFFPKAYVEEVDEP